MKKRILSVLLCLCMVITLLPTTVLADESPVDIDNKYISTYDGLVTALNGVATVSKSGTPEKITVRLSQGIKGRIEFAIQSAYIIFDAAGHTVYGTGKNEALCLVHDKSMTVELTGGGVYNSGDNNTIFVGNGNTLKIKSATINGSNNDGFNRTINAGEDAVTVVKEEGSDAVGVKIGENGEVPYYNDENTFPSISLAEQKKNIVVRQIVSGDHEHPICGASCSHSSDTHSDVIWTGVSTLTNDMAAGNYYLTGNVTLTDTWKPGNGVNLCLNGKSITANGDFDAIKVESSKTFTLTDCKTGDEQGRITHEVGKNGRGVYTTGTFNMYGGIITGNRAEIESNKNGGGVCTMGTGTQFTMYGGSIDHNTASGNGGGVYASGDGSAFTMSGGSITGNMAGNNGGGVFNGNGTFTVSGSVNVSGNTNGTGTGAQANNVYLGSTVITIGGALANTTPIGVTTESTPTEGTPVAITGTNSGDFSSHFASDIPDYEPFNDGNVVKLCVKVSTAIFPYAYDVQRDPPYPKAGDNVKFWDLGTPMAGGGPSGSWTLTRIGTYSAVEAEHQAELENLVQNFVVQAYGSALSKDTIVIHELKNNGTHVAYGVVTAYDTVNGYAAFIGGSSGYGYLLSKDQKNTVDTVNVIAGSITDGSISYTVTFDPNGGTVSPTSASVSAGDTLPSLPTPTHSGSYSFVGWYTAPTGGTQVTTSSVFNSNTTIYAQWTYTGGSYTPSIDSDDDDEPTYKVDSEVSKDTDGTVSVKPSTAEQGDQVTITVTPDRYYKVDGVIVKDQNGKKITVTENADGTFTFKMPSSKVTVEPVFSWDNPFADVAEDAYYASAVEWALKNDITNGSGDASFNPDTVCTRAQIVTFLWRAAGCPEPAGTNSFTDVSADAYYAKAVAWAVEQGITNGTGGKFSPDAACTRAQVVAFLWRTEGSDAAGTANSFADVPANAYYTDAVNWAVENSITGGTSATTFSPAVNCTRAQIVTFLYRDMVE